MYVLLLTSIGEALSVEACRLFRRCRDRKFDTPSLSVSLLDLTWLYWLFSLAPHWNSSLSLSSSRSWTEKHSLSTRIVHTSWGIPTNVFGGVDFGQHKLTAAAKQQEKYELPTLAHCAARLQLKRRILKRVCEFNLNFYRVPLPLTARLSLWILSILNTHSLFISLSQRASLFLRAALGWQWFTLHANLFVSLTLLVFPFENVMIRLYNICSRVPYSSQARIDRGKLWRAFKRVSHSACLFIQH